jgi:hypothetical protein
MTEAQEHDPTPGPPAGSLAGEKRGPTADPGHPQPSTAEVESARILANEAREALRSAGLSDDQIRELADRYVAEDLGEDTDAFVAWARSQGTNG